MTKMKRLVVGGALAAVAMGGIVGLAGFGWGHGHGGKFMRRMIDAHVSDVLDELKATPDQRTKASGIEDKLLGDAKAVHEARRALMKQLASDFPNAQLDSAALDREAAPLKQAEETFRTDVRQSVLDVHAMLTPTQRQELAARMAKRGGGHEE